MGCDGINPLYEALDWIYRTATSYQQQLTSYIMDGAIKYKPKYVKGRRHDWVDIDKLDRLAIVNIEVNYWANEFWALRMGGHKYFTYTSPQDMLNISILRYSVCSHLVQYLR